jgi:hypothetical protein
MKSNLIFLAILGALLSCTSPQQEPTTFINPLNLNYRYQLDEPSRREAADPVIVLFQDTYYLFASKSGGYWASDNLVEWELIVPTGLPLEDYAPAAIEINGKLYFTAFNTGAIFATDDPRKGQWTKVADTPNYADPAFFLDDDGRLYMYDGCSNNGPIWVQELHPQTFEVLGDKIECFRPDYINRGWEVFGDDNLGGDVNGVIQYSPWNEGPWMTKHNGLYYLQYAAPGTQWKSYADGLFTSTSPTGPFEYAPYSPFSFKPSGFITGAGHGNTFLDKNGQYWHVATMVISVHHMFERRLGLYPTGFDADGVMYTNTYLADYPQKRPGQTEQPQENNLAGWMLLSFDKEVIASSTLDGFPTANAVDEEVRTWWSAATGDDGEWLVVNLEQPCDVHAIQVNFADQDSKAFGREEALYHQYKIEVSDDGLTWRSIIDKSKNKQDVPHDYVELADAVKTQYIKIENVHMPAQGTFALSGLRVFGIAPGEAPNQVVDSRSRRDVEDPRRALLEWPPSDGATGYVIRYGIAPDKLYNNYQIYKETLIDINSLNAGVDYFYAIDAFNEAGITKGSTVFRIE